MFTIHETTLQIPYRNAVKSLCWQGDILIDWISGGETYALNSTSEEWRWSPGYDRFDAAIMSPSGKYAIVYETLGTKGIIIDIGNPCITRINLMIGDKPAPPMRSPRLVREINRSYYCADAYAYPLTMFYLPDGREVVAHCPDEYNRLVIEDIASGKRLAESCVENPDDYFYSRLAVNTSGTRLLSAGWVWHPCSFLSLYDINAVLHNPQLLDRKEAMFRTPTELSSAAFFGDNLLVVASASDPEYEEKDSWLPPCAVAVYDLLPSQCVVSAQFEEPMGTVLPINAHLAISLYDHPKLIDLQSGQVVHRWSDIASGKQESCILRGDSPIPPMALDPAQGRIAVASEDAIRVIEVRENNNSVR